MAGERDLLADYGGYAGGRRGVSAESSASFCQQSLANVGREATTEETMLMLHMLKPHKQTEAASCCFPLFSVPQKVMLLTKVSLTIHLFIQHLPITCIVFGPVWALETQQ